MPAYNNYYPNLYQPYNAYLQNQMSQIPQTPMQQPNPIPQANISQPVTTGMIWISNEQEANTYPVAPNNAVALWDSNNPVVYVKQADASGKPYLKIYDLTERTQTTSGTPKPEFAEKTEIEGLKADFDGFRNELKAIKKDITNLKRKRDEIDDE